MRNIRQELINMGFKFHSHDIQDEFVMYVYDSPKFNIEIEQEVSYEPTVNVGTVTMRFGKIKSATIDYKGTRGWEDLDMKYLNTKQLAKILATDPDHPFFDRSLA